MDDFARVKEAVDLVDVVSRYVELKRAGTRMVGCCPFHAEKSPSFGIPNGAQYFKCFGCGKGGDVFTFLAEVEHIERVDALHRLAEEKNVPLSGGHGANRDEKERLLRVLAAAQELHRKAFESESLGRAARELVAARKLAPKIVEAFGLGYGPIEPGRRFDSAVIANRLVKAGHRREDVVAAGVAIERDGGALLDAAYSRDRVTIPIRDERGRVVAFGGRRLRDGEETKDVPKYVNSRETLLFSKGRLLYGLDRARATILREQRVVLVEGYLDVILAHQGGLDVAVAALGTSVTSEHAKQLARLAPKVVLFLDGDPAGQRAAERAVPLLLAEKLEVRVLVLTSDKDPGDYFARGATRDDFEKLLAKDGVSGLDYLLERAGRREARSIDDRIRVARHVGEQLALVVDPLARAGHVSALERELDLPNGSLDAALALRRERRPVRPLASALGEIGGNGAGRGGAAPANGDGKVPPDVQEVAALPRAQVAAEEEVLLALLSEPPLRAAAKNCIPPGAFADPARAALFLALVEDPSAEASRVLETVLGKFSEEPDAQQKLADLVHRPASADPGKLFDGAVRWFVEQRRKQAMDEVRARFGPQLKQGDPSAAAEFLQAFEAARRAGGTN